MRLKTALMGSLAVVAAFGSAYAVGSTRGEPAVAHVQPAKVIALGEAPRVPLLSQGEAPPPLAKVRVRRHRRRVERRAEPPATRREEPAPDVTPAPFTAPKAPAPKPQPQPRAPRPDRSYDEPDYEPPAPRATPGPTPVPPREPDPIEEVPEDGTPE